MPHSRVSESYQYAHSFPIHSKYPSAYHPTIVRLTVYALLHTCMNSQFLRCPPFCHFKFKEKYSFPILASDNILNNRFISTMDSSISSQVVWQQILGLPESWKIVILAQNNLIPAFASFLFINTRSEYQSEELPPFKCSLAAHKDLCLLANSSAGYLQLLVTRKEMGKSKKPDPLGRFVSLILQCKSRLRCPPTTWPCRI